MSAARPAGYSGTPLPKKLGIKAEARVGLLGAPEHFDATLGELPPGVEVRRQARGPLDVIVAFFTRRSDLEWRLAALQRAMDAGKLLDVTSPNQALLREVLDASLERIEWGRDVAERLYPWLRANLEGPKSIVIDQATPSMR